MPEGPEVRLNSELLGRLLLGRQVDGIRPVSGKLHRTGVPGLDRFKPSVVRSATAHGKLIVIRFLDGSALTSTLGMSGWWYPPPAMAEKLYASDRAYQSGKMVQASAVVKRALTYARVELLERGEPVAVFTDMRNFGNIEYHPDGLSQEQVAKRIGLDLLNELPIKLADMQAAKLYLLELKRRAPKRLLNLRLGDLALEQSFIAGLGNIYRAEMFWLTGLDPHQRFAVTTDDDWLMLCELGMVVLQIAYTTRGVMHYPADLIEGCTGLRRTMPHRGHLAYGQQVDIFGRAIVRDDSFNRTLWRLATV